MRDNRAEDVISMNRACGYGCVNYIINSVVGCHDEAASGGYVVLMHLMAMVMESVLIASQVQAPRASSLISWASLQGSLSRDKRRFDWRHRERSHSLSTEVRSRSLACGAAGVLGFSRSGFGIFDVAVIDSRVRIKSCTKHQTASRRS
jgi:hypothetical protein